MNSKYCLTFGLSALLGLSSWSVTAQTARVTRVTMPDTLVVAPGGTVGKSASSQHSSYGALLGIEDYDKLSDTDLLPITREQAEEVIAATILAARAPGQEAINRAKVLNDFKVETLRKRLLEQALRKSYADEYEHRLDKLENFILLLLANNGLSPDAITSLLAGTGGTPAGANSMIVPNTSLADETVALAPGAKASSWEHFLSQVFYGYDSSTLDDEAKVVLDNVAGWIQETGMGVTLRGWASPEGKMSYNNKLSGRRVQAAADYLKSKGISGEMLKVIPSGIDSMKDTKSKYPAGRRVDIRPDYGEKEL